MSNLTERISNYLNEIRDLETAGDMLLQAALREIKHLSDDVQTESQIMCALCGSVDLVHEYGSKDCVQRLRDRYESVAEENAVLRTALYQIAEDAESAMRGDETTPIEEIPK